MKHTLTTSVLLFIIFPVVLSIQITGCSAGDEKPAVQTTTDTPMRLLSFNIRFDNPNDGPNAWPHRKDFVTDLIRFHKIDLFGTQEGMAHQIKDMDELLADFDWIGVGRDAGDERGEFCTIFYRTDRFEVLEEGTFWLSRTPGIPGSVGWDAALPRIVTWARFSDSGNNRRFIVFNTHFDHIGTEARLNSSKLILEKVNEIADGDPIIVMGDLNVTEDQEPYKILAEPNLGPVELELFDGFYHSENGHYGPVSTWNGFDRIFPDRRIDFIFSDAGFRFLEHGILADSRDGRFPSDHLPVLAEIMFRDN